MLTYEHWEAEGLMWGLLIFPPAALLLLKQDGALAIIFKAI